VPADRPLLPAALIGVATGLRSQIGLAALLLSSHPEDLPRRWRSVWLRLGSGAGAAGELLVDKLPFAPDRIAPSSVGLRAGMGMLTASVATSGRGERPAPPAAVAGAAALAATYAGFFLRRALSRRFRPLTVAVAEDFVAAGTALLGVRLLARSRPA
jgi:uncharacterized membrane protein